MSNMERRLDKLELQVQSTVQHILWLDAREDGSTKIAELIASGVAKATDKFVLVSWAEGACGSAPEGKRNWRSKETIALWKLIKSLR